MASTETLTSLAMLKVHVDHGRDYLDYLRPFILQILVDHRPDPVTDAGIRDYLRAQFGLEIPERAVQVVLKRLTHSQPLTRDMGVYRITGELKNPGIAAEKAKATRHIQAVIAGLMEFSKTTSKPIATENDAVRALCGFLTEFNIPCLRAYLRGTAIPTVNDKLPSDIVLVSEYILSLQKTTPERFDSLLVVVQGHMLANALLCPDLQSAPRSYQQVVFYFDTPLLIQRLGLEGSPKQAAIENLVKLLRHLGGRVATFMHSRDELEHVIKGAADHVGRSDGRSTIVAEARRRGTTRADLLLLAGQIGAKLSEADIEVFPTPRYIKDFQIDETAFADALDDEVSYFNPRAKEYDIKSVRSIYVLREHTSPYSIEQARAILVTSNTGFARAAYTYGQKHEESRQVASVVVDFSLANMAWLKAPMGAPSLPMTEVIAFSYAAMQPSRELLDKFMTEIEKLEKQGKITPRDHQLLRSSSVAQEELVRLTLGDESALTEETVTETLRRVTNEIKKEEDQKLTAEQVAHAKTLSDLQKEREEKQRIQERLYWRCRQRAKRYSWAVAITVGVVLIAGIVAGFVVTPKNAILGRVLAGLFAVATIAGVVDLLVDFSVRQMREKLERRLLAWLVKREAAATGLSLGGWG